MSKEVRIMILKGITNNEQGILNYDFKGIANNDQGIMNFDFEGNNE
jgi:hypothetical protein